MSKTRRDRRPYGCLLFVSVAFAVGTCRSGQESHACKEPFVACGGDPTGTWEIASACIEGDLQAALNDGLSPECANSVTAVDWSETGTVSFNSGTVSRTGTTVRATSISYLPACASAICKCDGASIGGCQEMQKINQNGDPDRQVTCKHTDTSCDCSAKTTKDISGESTYTVNGTSLDEAGRLEISFCVAGDSLIQREPLYGTNVFLVKHLRKR